MQTFQIEVNDNIADKVLWFLENLKESVKITKVEKPSLDESDLTKSIKDLENGNIVPIDDIDRYIKELSDEIK